MSNFYGDNPRWFLGDVKSISDPLELGRIQVRVHGIHSESQQDIPDSVLPWAQTVVPITQGGTNGLGNNLGIKVGAMVFGVFLDGSNSQLPLVLGSMPKYEDGSPGGLSTNQLARGTPTITKTPNSAISEPSSPYAASYPNNNVYQTKSGHVIEIDDTENAERIHIFHKSGTFIEMHPNGDVVTQHKNGWRSVTGNDKLHVNGDLNIIATGKITMNAPEINLNNGTKGAARLDDESQGTDPAGVVGGTVTSKVTKSSGTVFIGD